MGDVYVQTVACFESSIAAIKELGGSKLDVLRTRIMLIDIFHWEAAAKAHGDYFQNIQPASCSGARLTRLNTPHRQMTAFEEDRV